MTAALIYGEFWGTKWHNRDQLSWKCIS